MLSQELEEEPMLKALLPRGERPVVKYEAERYVEVALVEVTLVKRPVVAKRSVAVAEAKTAKVE